MPGADAEAVDDEAARVEEGVPPLDVASSELQRCASRGLPSGWEVHTSRSTGADFYFCVVSGASTYERPAAEHAALPEGWSHDSSTRTGETYFISPSGESTYELPPGVGRAGADSGGGGQPALAGGNAAASWLGHKKEQLAQLAALPEKKRLEKQAAKEVAQLQLGELAGLAVEGVPQQDYNGVYLPAGVHDGWTRFESSEGKHLFRDGAEWVMLGGFILDHAAGSAVAYTKADDVALPLGAREWQCVPRGQPCHAWTVAVSPLAADALTEHTERLRMVRNLAFGFVLEDCGTLPDALLKRDVFRPDVGMSEGQPIFRAVTCGSALYFFREHGGAQDEDQWIFTAAGSDEAEHQMQVEKGSGIAHRWTVAEDRRSCVLVARENGVSAANHGLYNHGVDDHGHDQSYSRWYTEHIAEHQTDCIDSSDSPPGLSEHLAVHRRRIAPTPKEELLAIYAAAHARKTPDEIDALIAGWADGATLVKKIRDRYEGKVQVPLGVQSWQMVDYKNMEVNPGDPEFNALGWTTATMTLRACGSAMEADEEAAAAAGSGIARHQSLNVGHLSGEEQTEVYHGTDSRSALQIVLSQHFRPSSTGLGGEGVYLTLNARKAEGCKHTTNDPDPQHNVIELGRI